MAPQRRALQVLVIDSDDRRLLATRDGALPAWTVNLPPDETTVGAAARTVRAELALGAPILEILFDHARAYGPDDAVPVLVVMEAPDAGWSPPDALGWPSLGGSDPAVATELRPRLEELLAERRGRRDVPERRAAWARPGWYVRASGWIGDTLAAHGRQPTGPAEQVRHWGLSAIMRTPTDGGTVWFKAVFRPLFAHEPAVSELLDREARGSVPPVVATDSPEGWILLEDIGSDHVARHPEADESAVAALVAVQRRFVGRSSELVAVGVPHRPLASLADDLTAALDEPATLEWVDVTPARGGELVAAVRVAVAEVERLGYPETLVHGDFHAENVALLDGRPIVFDWSDAAVAHPLVDAMTWSGWFDHDGVPEERRARGPRGWCSFIEAWADVCPPDRAEAAHDALVRVAAAYHTVSYAAIVHRLEPLLRPGVADGLQGYFGELDGAVPR